jgi:FMN phosphatase YigB (HAD superfamily)
LGVFADAGLDSELAEALYAVESDPRHNPFALDVRHTLEALGTRGVRVAVVSDIHFDLRPVFDAAGLGKLVDVFTLSCEQGVQKPNPLVFRRTLEALGARADDALMVGDRSRPDGAAVESGITTLLLPTLRAVEDRRLHKVLRLLDAE